MSRYLFQKNKNKITKISLPPPSRRIRYFSIFLALFTIIFIPYPYNHHISTCPPIHHKPVETQTVIVDAELSFFKLYPKFLIRGPVSGHFPFLITQIAIVRTGMHKKPPQPPVHMLSLHM